MSSDPLRINLEVNTADTAKLADAVQQITVSVKSLASQFLAGGTSARDIAAATQSFAESLTDSNPQVVTQVTALENMKASLATARVELKDFSAGLYEQGVMIGGTTGYMEALGTKAQQVAAQEAIFKEMSSQVASGLAAQATAADTAGAANTGLAAKTAEASAASAKAAEGSEEQTVAAKEQGEVALTTGRAIVEGSESVRKASAAFLELERQADMASEAMAKARAEYKAAVPESDAAAAAAEKYAAALGDLAIRQRDAKAAQAQLKTEMQASYTALQSRATAAAPTSTTGASAAATAAQSKEAAVGGSVTSELQLEAEGYQRVAQAATLMAAGITQNVAAEQRYVSAAQSVVADLEGEVAAAERAGTVFTQENLRVESLGIAARQAATAIQAKSDAEAADAAAGEGMVATDVALASQENTVAQASRSAAQARTEATSASVASQEKLSATTQLLQSIMQEGAHSIDQATASLTKQGVPAERVSAALKELGLSAQGAAAAQEQAASATASATTSAQGQVAPIEKSAIAYLELQKSIAASSQAMEQAKAAYSAAAPNTEAAAAAARNYATSLRNLTAQSAEAAAAQHELSGAIGASDKAIAYSSGRIAAWLGGLGQAGFAIARLAAQIPGLTAIFSAIFPIILVGAFIDVLENADKKLREWAETEQKAADDAAKFEREMAKSAEAVDRMNEKLAGQIGPLAELAVRMADAGHKMADVSGEVQSLNKYIGEQTDAWGSSATTIGKAWLAVSGIFRDESSKSAIALNLFLRQVQDGVHTVSDLPPAIQKLKDEHKALQAQLDAYTASQWISVNQQVVANLKEQMNAVEELTKAWQNEADAAALTAKADLREEQAKLSVDRVRLGEENLSYQQSIAKSLETLHATTAAEEYNTLVKLNDQKATLEQADISRRRALLKEEQADRPDVNLGPERESLRLEQEAKITASNNRKLALNLDYNKQVLEEDKSTADAQISYDAKVAEANLSLIEAKQKVAFTRADTPLAIESASQDILRTTNSLYEIRTEEIKKNAAALLDELTAERSLANLPTPKITAEVGTDEYAKQLQNIRNFAPQIYAQLLAMNSNEISLREQGKVRSLEIEQEKWEKIKSFYSGALNDAIGALNDLVAEEKAKYQEGSQAIKTELDERKITQSGYYNAIKALASEHYAAEKSDLDQETALAYAAYNEQYISANELQHRLNEINKAEIADEKQKWKEIGAAAQEEITKEEAQIKTVTNKISEDFTRAFNQLLTTHESVGQAAKKLGAELELYIIDQGIKRVVTAFTSDMLRMVSAHKIAAAQQEVDEASKNANLLTQNQVYGTLYTSQQLQQTTAHQAAVAQQSLASTTAMTQQQAQLLLYSTNYMAQQTLQTAEHQAAQTAQTGATVAAQVAQTGAVAAGATQQGLLALAANLKMIEQDAAASAANAYKWASAWGGPIAGAIAAAATFVAVMAFASLEGGGTVAQKQPVLVHSGEVIAHQDTLSALDAGNPPPPSSSGMAHVMKVQQDQVSMLSPGQVVVPRALAGDLTNVVSMKGGTVGVAEGTTPPSGIREIPQRLPSSMSSTISGIIKESVGTQTPTVGGATYEKIPTAAGGFVFSAAAGSVFVPAAGYAPSQHVGTTVTHGPHVSHAPSVHHHVTAAREGYVFSAREGYSTNARFVPSSGPAHESFVTNARFASSGQHLSSAKEGYVFSAREGFAHESMSSARYGYVHGLTTISAREGYSTSSQGIFTAREGFTASHDTLISSAKEGYSIPVHAIASAADGAISPTHSSAFLGASIGLSTKGGPGGIGGPGGPGGAGGDAGTANTYHQNFRLEMHNHGGALTPDDVTKAVKRALRRGELP